MKKQDGPRKDSIEYIAKTLKLSPATISRVLNNHPHVNAATRAKVMALVEKVGYRPNVIASALRTHRSNTIGLIVPRISMFIHAEIITTVQNGLRSHGYHLIICQSNDSVELEKELVQNLYALRVNAVIAACTLHTSDFSHFDILTQNKIPVIFYDRVPVKPYPACVIKGDDIRGAYLSTSHLIQLGSRRIACICGPLDSNIYIDRYKGFEKAMAQYGIPIKKDMVFLHELTIDNARNSMRRLFAKEPYPDAIFAANDVTALAALDYARETGIQIPKDLRIVGYSNDPRSSMVSPSLTTIEQFPAIIGTAIVAELLKILRNGVQHAEIDNTPIITPVELIRRMST